MSIHSELRGDNVHQPKGAEGASNGQVMQATGVGTTAWVDLFIKEYLPRLTVEALGSYVSSPLADTTGITEIPTEIRPLNEGVTERDELVNENFAALTAAVNNSNTYLYENVNKVVTDFSLLEAKVNAIISLLQKLKIARETY